MLARKRGASPNLCFLRVALRAVAVSAVLRVAGEVTTPHPPLSSRRSSAAAVRKMFHIRPWGGRGVRGGHGEGEDGEGGLGEDMVRGVW